MKEKDKFTTSYILQYLKVKYITNYYSSKKYF